MQGGLEQRLSSAVASGSSQQHILPKSAAAVADFNDTVQQLIYDLLMLKVLKALLFYHRIDAAPA